MRRLLLPLILSCAALAPAAVTTTAVAASEVRPPGRACFYSREVRAFTKGAGDTVNLRIGARDVYQLTLLSECIDLDWERALRLEARVGGSWICDGQAIDLITSVDRCPVSGVRRLSEEEIAALPSKERP